MPFGVSGLLLLVSNPLSQMAGASREPNDVMFMFKQLLS